MKKYFSINKGFTLIELLVVIAIIAILSAIVMSSIFASRSKARDAKRVADISQIQLALEQYFDKNGNYPNTTASLSPNYISVIPTAPSPGSYLYGARTDSPFANSDYILRATLENNNADVLNDSLNTMPVGATYSGFGASSCLTTSKYYCVGPK